MKQKVLVMGASTNPSRYSFIATNMLLEYGHEVHLFGIKKGEVAGITIQNDFPSIDELDTITLYLGPQNQPQYYNDILSAGAKRVIFNPGTENPELVTKLKEKGIYPEIACTLVLLRSEQFAF